MGQEIVDIYTVEYCVAVRKNKNHAVGHSWMDLERIQLNWSQESADSANIEWFLS